MTVTTLGNDHPTQVLPRQQVTVGLYAGEPAELLVLGEPDPEVGRQPRQVVIPRAALDRPLRLHVRPPGTELFGPGSRVKLTVRAGAAGSDSVSVQVDLSGSAGADLLTLDPLDPDHLRVTVVRRPDPLSELATTTRAATGRALAAAGLRPVPRRVVLQLDRSPSTAPWWTSGAMTSAVDALVGVAVACSEEPPVVVPGRAADGAEVGEVAGAPAHLAAAVAALGDCVPFRAGAAPVASGTDLVWWVSDAPPPQVARSAVAGTVVLTRGPAGTFVPRPGSALVEVVLADPLAGAPVAVGPAAVDPLAAFGVEVVGQQGEGAR